MHSADQSTGFQGESHELRWFLLPSEARDLFKKNIKVENLIKSPFFVRKEIPENSYADYKLVDQIVEKLKSIKNWEKSTIKPKDEKVVENGNVKKNEKRKLEIKETEPEECTDEVCVPCMPRPKRAKPETKPVRKRKMIHPPKALLRKVGDAIEEFSMIKDQDRVIVGLSGGKDSLTLLHALLQYRYIARAQR